jgi:nucleoside-diphosphate-sugar epimerase
MAAYHDSGFPVTIIKPSTTYGPRMGLLRQIGGDGSWIDRIRKGKPILVCGDGTALHQFMHVDDAALCFTHVLDHPHTVGQTYNMVHRGYMPWSDYHRTTMKIIGREVEMVGVPLAELLALDTPGVGIAKDIFSHNTIYSSEKLFRDVAQFQPSVSLEDGISELIEIMDGDGRITDSDEQPWEDQVIAAQKSVRGALVA